MARVLRQLIAIAWLIIISTIDAESDNGSCRPRKRAGAGVFNLNSVEDEPNDGKKTGDIVFVLFEKANTSLGMAVAQILSSPSSSGVWQFRLSGNSSWTPVPVDVSAKNVALLPPETFLRFASVRDYFNNFNEDGRPQLVFYAYDVFEIRSENRPGARFDFNASTCQFSSENTSVIAVVRANADTLFLVRDSWIDADRAYEVGDLISMMALNEIRRGMVVKSQEPNNLWFVDGDGSGQFRPLNDDDKLDATARIKFDGQVIAASGDCELYAEFRADVFSYDPVTMNKSGNFKSIFVRESSVCDGFRLAVLSPTQIDVNVVVSMKEEYRSAVVAVFVFFTFEEAESSEERPAQPVESAYEIDLWKNVRVGDNATFARQFVTLQQRRPYTIKFEINTKDGTNLLVVKRTATTFSGVPDGPPRNLLVTVSESSPSATWQDPELAFYSRSTPYSYVVFVDGLSTIRSTSQVFGFPPGRISGLPAFEEYEIRVVMSNENGAGPFSDPFTFRTLPEVPSEPINFNAFPINDSAVGFRWEHPEFPRGILREFSLAIAQSPIDSPPVDLPPISISSVANYFFLKLPLDASYDFEIRAVNDVGASPVATKSLMSEPPKPPMSDPVLLTVTRVDNRTVNISWIVQPTTSVPERPYFVVKTPNRDCARARNETMNVGVGEINAIRIVTFGNLRPYTVYTFCVWRGENAEQDPVRTHYFVPQAVPSPVVDLTMINTSLVNMSLPARSTSAALSWLPPRDPNGPIGYEIFAYDVVDRLVYYRRLNARTRTSWRVTGLEGDKTYEIIVRVYNLLRPEWTSENRSVVVSTPTGFPQSVENVVVNDVTATTATVSWSPPNATNGVIVEYEVTAVKVPRFFEPGSFPSDFRGRRVTSVDGGTGANRAVLVDLDGATSYFYWVRARTDAGWGRRTNLFSTFETRCPIDCSDDADCVRDGWTWSCSCRDGRLGDGFVCLGDPQFAFNTITSTSFAVTFSIPTGDDVIRENVMFRLLTPDNRLAMNASTASFAPDASRFTGFVSFFNLQPFTRYTMVIIVQVGQFSASFNASETTQTAVPSASPKNVAVVNVMSTSAILTWTPVPEPFQNGPIFYAVNSVKSTAPFSPLPINNLVSYQPYSFRIFAGLLFSDGEGFEGSSLLVESFGPPSSPVHFRSGVDVPDPVTSLFARLFNSTTIVVGWDYPAKPNGIIEYFRVLLTSEIRTIQRNSSSSRSFAFIPIIDNSISYVISVRVVGTGGTSLPRSHDFPINPIKTDGSPDLQATVLNSTSVRLSLSFSFNNSFRVEIERTRGEVSLRQTIQQANVMSWIESNLLPFTFYSFTAESSDSAGLLHRTSIVAQTLPAEPGPVREFRVDDITFDSVAISWLRPNESDGGPIEYYVTIRDETIRLDWNQLPPREESVRFEWLVQDLEGNSTYTIAVKAHNFIDNTTGPETRTKVITPTGHPEAPRSVSVMPTALDTLTVTWQSPRRTHGRLTHYILTAVLLQDSETGERLPTDSYGYPRYFLFPRIVNVFDPTKTEATIDGLFTDTRYAVWIQAATENFEGERSGVKSVRVLSEAIVKTRIDVVDATSIFVKFSVVGPPDSAYVDAAYAVDVRIRDDPSLQVTTNWSERATPPVSLRVVDLQPYTNYTLINSIRNGDRLLYEETTNLSMPVARPTATPTGAVARLLDGMTISLTWLPPISVFANGPINGYVVQMRSNPPGDDEGDFDVIRSTLFNVNVKPFRTYSFRVAAYNDRSELGPFGDEVVQVVPPAAPGSPQIAFSYQINSTHAVVHWNYPVESNGVITNFSVVLEYSSGTVNETLNVNALQRYAIMPLPQPVRFPIFAHVRALSESLVGSTATLFVQQNFDIAGEAMVEQLSSSSQEGVTVRLHWPSVNAGGDAFNIIYTSGSDQGACKNERGNFFAIVDGLNVTIANLLFNTFYTFCVRKGEFEDQAFILTSSSTPGEVTSPTITDTTSTTIGISWEPPSTPNGNVGYEMTVAREGTMITRTRLDPSALPTIRPFRRRLMGLEPGVVYDVSIRAFNVDDVRLVGPASNLSVSTTPLPPTAPTAIEAVPLIEEVEVTWSRPHRPNGNLKFYEVSAVMAQMSGEVPRYFLDRRRVPVEASSSSYKISSIRNAVYMVWVTAANEYGTSPQSEFAFSRGVLLDDNCTSYDCIQAFVLNETFSFQDGAIWTYYLTQLTSVANDLSAQNINEGLDVLQSIVDGQGQAIIDQVVDDYEFIELYEQNVIQAISDLLDSDRTETLLELAPSTGAPRILSIAEQFGQISAALLVLSNATVQRRVTASQNAVLDVRSVTEDNLEAINFPNYSAPVYATWTNQSVGVLQLSSSLLQSLLNDGRGPVFVSNILFNNVENTMPIYNSSAEASGNNVPIETSRSTFLSRSIGTVVISTSISRLSNGGAYDPTSSSRQNLPEPILINFTNVNTTDANAKFTCSFWNFSNSGGFWSAQDVQTQASGTAVVCNSTHLTSFAVLVAVHSFTDSKVLEYFTYIGCGISLLALLITVVCLIVFRKSLHKERTWVNVNFCIALMLGLIFFLAGIDQTSDRPVCKAMTVIMHYLFLCVFSWMLCEGLLIYFMLVIVFDTGKSYVKQYFALGWGLPLVIVAVSFGIRFDDYGQHDHCFLTTDKNMIWAFVGPMLGIILVNAIFFVIALKKLFGRRMMEKSKKVVVKSALKATAVLVPVLGLTWIIGVFAIDTLSVPLDYAFTIINSLQGLFIFLFHVVFNEQIRKAFRHRRDKYKKTKSLGKSIGTPSSGTKTTGNKYEVAGVSSTVGSGSVALQPLSYRSIDNTMVTSSVPASSQVSGRVSDAHPIEGMISDLVANDVPSSSVPSAAERNGLPSSQASIADRKAASALPLVRELLQEEPAEPTSEEPTERTKSERSSTDDDEFVTASWTNDPKPSLKSNSLVASVVTSDSHRNRDESSQPSGQTDDLLFV